VLLERGYDRKGGIKIACKEVRLFGMLFCRVNDRMSCSESRWGLSASDSEVDAPDEDGEGGKEGMVEGEDLKKKDW
jgi:hypothetical protein